MCLRCESSSRRAFNQEKAPFSVIVKTNCETDGSSAALIGTKWFFKLNEKMK